MTKNWKPPAGTDRFYQYVGLRHFDRYRAGVARKDEKNQRRIEDLQDRLTMLEKQMTTWRILVQEEEEQG